MNRKRYMISWKNKETTGRDHWVMERRGKLSSADIKELEMTLAKKWGFTSPVVIMNIVLIN